MANPNWKKGVSGNPHGRRKKQSAPTIQRMVERFVQRNITPRRLQKLYDSLQPRDKLLLLSDLLPYTISKRPTLNALALGQLTDEQASQLMDQVAAGLMEAENKNGLLPPITPHEEINEP